MVLVEDGYSFNDLVNIAYKEIRDAVNEGKYDLINDIVDDTNWSEICYWCGFPDIQKNESIYERAINLATMQVMVDEGVKHSKIKEYIDERISEPWNQPYTTKNYESYSNGDDMCMFINDNQLNIPKEYYYAIKRGDL